MTFEESDEGRKRQKVIKDDGSGSVQSAPEGRLGRESVYALAMSN